MSAITFAIVIAAGVAFAYYAGKRYERSKIHRWLRFLHDEMWEEFTPQQLAAMISVGQHYE